MANAVVLVLLLALLLAVCCHGQPATIVYFVSSNNTADHEIAQFLRSSPSQLDASSPNMVVVTSRCVNSSVDAATAAGAHIILTSSSCSSGNIRKFGTTSIPVLTWEPEILHSPLENLCLTNLSQDAFDADVQFVTASTSSYQLLTGLASPFRDIGPTLEHPITAGFTSGENISWCTSAQRATVISPNLAAGVRPLLLALPPTGTWSVINVVEKGSALVNLNAPARRVSFGLTDNTWLQVLPATKDAFLTAVRWAVDENSPPDFISSSTTPGQVQETDADPDGVLVDFLVSELGVSDPDESLYAVFFGIAVFDNDATAAGEWQYFDPSKSMWQPMSSGSQLGDANALHLTAHGGTRVRYLPVAGNRASSRIRFYAWDRSNVNYTLSVSGTYGDTTGRGSGTSPYSSSFGVYNVSVLTATATTTTTTTTTPTTTASSVVTVTTGTSGTTIASTSSTSDTAATSASSSASGFPIEIIIGVAVAGAVLCCLIVLGVVILVRKRSKGSEAASLPNEEGDDSASVQIYLPVAIPSQYGNTSDVHSSSASSSDEAVIYAAVGDFMDE